MACRGSKTQGGTGGNTARCCPDVTDLAPLPEEKGLPSLRCVGLGPNISGQHIPGCSSGTLTTYMISTKGQHLLSLRSSGPRNRGSLNLLVWGLSRVLMYRVDLTMSILRQLRLHPRHPLGLSRREKVLERAGMLFGWRDGAEGNWPV